MDHCQSNVNTEAATGGLRKIHMKTPVRETLFKSNCRAKT